jgi:hypothetical protein
VAAALAIVLAGIFARTVQAQQSWAQSFGARSYDENGAPTTSASYGSGYDVAKGIARMPDSAVAIGFLVGDTSGNGSVNTTDIGQTKAQSGQAVTTSDFRTDVTVNGGAISSSDIGLVKSAAGTQLP